MKTFFIESRYKGSIDFALIESNKLPGKLGLFTTVQYLDFLAPIKAYLENAGKEVMLFRTNAAYPGQILGCSVQRFEGVDAYLYVGDGSFHPMALSIENDKPVFIFNPMPGSFYQLDTKIAEKIRKKRNGAIARFHLSSAVGVLVSIKSGQMDIDAVKTLRERYPDKKFYALVFDTLDFSQLENFNFCECFVNTACPRIGLDDFEKSRKPIINYQDLF